MTVSGPQSTGFERAFKALEKIATNLEPIPQMAKTLERIDKNSQIATATQLAQASIIATQKADPATYIEQEDLHNLNNKNLREALNQLHMDFKDANETDKTKASSKNAETKIRERKHEASNSSKAIAKPSQATKPKDPNELPEDFYSWNENDQVEYLRAKPSGGNRRASANFKQRSKPSANPHRDTSKMSIGDFDINKLVQDLENDAKP